LKLLPYQPIQQATRTIERIAQQTEYKAMYDAREKARRDEGWIARAAYREGEREGELKGKIEGKIELVRALEGLLHTLPTREHDLRAMTLDQLESLASSLQDKLRNRAPS
jgi:predicted transposase YdaD